MRFVQFLFFRHALAFNVAVSVILTDPPAFAFTVASGTVIVVVCPLLLSQPPSAIAVVVTSVYALSLAVLIPT